MPFATAADGCRLHYTLHGPADAPALLIGYPWNDGMAALLQPAAPKLLVPELPMEKALTSIYMARRLCPFLGS